MIKSINFTNFKKKYLMIYQKIGNILIITILNKYLKIWGRIIFKNLIII